jgi:hypothetical protein
MEFNYIISITPLKRNIVENGKRREEKGGRKEHK